MNVYIYQADLWCKDCGEWIKKELIKEGKAPEDPDDEYSYDSDEFPKGPFGDGGGESDTPQHCGSMDDCINAITLSDGSKVGAFLENDLTEEGQRYVKEAVLEAEVQGEKGSVAIEIWKPFYDYIEYPKVVDEKEVKKLFTKLLKEVATAGARKIVTSEGLTELAVELDSRGYEALAEEVENWEADRTIGEYEGMLQRWLDNLDQEGTLRR